MSERHIECSTCKVIRPEIQARVLPTYRPETTSFTDGYYCVVHAPAALASVHQHIAGLDFDDDDDDMTPLLMLVALLRARGQQIEDLRADEFDPAGAQGMDRIRLQVLALLRRLEHGPVLPISEPAAMCSDCFHLLPASQIRVLPWYNDSANDYVTTFRCRDCFEKAIAETRAHLEAGGDREVVRLAEFFGRHAFTILEYRRGDPPAAVRPLLLHLLNMLGAGNLTLPIGETVPLAEALSQPAPAPPTSSPPPQAPPPQPSPAARPSLWSRLFGRKSD